MFKHTHWLCVILLTNCVGQADTGGESGGGTGTSGASGFGGHGASSGSGGDPGTGADAATDGHAGAAGYAGAGGHSGYPPISCGAVTCEGAEPLPGFPLAPCCPTGLVDTCGVDLSLLQPAGAITPGDPCVRANAPGNLDTSCPTVSLGGGAVTLAGCCTPAGLCAFQADIAALGCADPSTLGIAMEGGIMTCVPQVDGG